MLSDEIIKHLLQKAEAAKQNSYSPYSKFRVGACLLDDEGNEYIGCNVENASYGVAICAERTALVNAVSQGARKFAAIAVTSDSDKPTYPCGICRQALVELSPDMYVISANDKLDDYTIYKAGELLPHYFSGDDM